MSENPCALYCMSETNLVTSLRPKVIDGTTCYRGIRDICIGGVCREIPCDLHMESTAVEDVCGVCRGDSTSCTLKQGTLSFMAQSRKKERNTITDNITVCFVRVHNTQLYNTSMKYALLNNKYTRRFDFV